MISQLNEAQHMYLLSWVSKRKLPRSGWSGQIRISAYLLGFVVEGEGVILLDGVLHKIKPFQLYLLVPGMVLDIPEGSGSFDYYAVRFEPMRLLRSSGRCEGELLPLLPGPLSPGLLPVHRPQSMLQAFELLHESGRREPARHSFAGRLQLEQLLHELMRSDPPAAAVDERVQRSLAYMNLHYKQKLSIQQLAESAGEMSGPAFSRLFRHETGTTPIEYLNRVRMEHGKRMLNGKDARVKEVAAEVGFRSEFYFSRMFQRRVGVSPSLYMKRGTLKVAVASSLSLHDHLTSIEIEPVCTVDLFRYPGQSDAEYAERLADQLRRLREAKPDLIVADEYHAEFEEEFKRTAAPVFLDFSVWDWKRNFEQIAELVGREREASEMLTRLYMQAEITGRELRRALGSERLTMLQVNHRTVGIQGRAKHPLNELVYGELGLKPCMQTPREVWRLEMPPEALPVLEAEHLFIHQHHVLAGSADRYRELTGTSAWSAAEAVKQGNVYDIPNWFAMSWTPLGRQRIMNELRRTLGRADAAR